MNGVVKNITPKRGFGFIRGDDNKEYFFHRDNFSGHWEDLETDLFNKNKITVKFEPGTGAKGPRADNVSRVDWPNQVPG